MAENENGNENSRETRIATAIKALTPRELEAYKYFLRVKQAELSEEASDSLYALFLQGQSCEEIRRVAKGYGLGQIVAARIAHDWDGKAAAYRGHLVETVPVKAEQTHLETVDYLSDLLKATYMKHQEVLKLYFATGDARLLDGVPLPRNMKDLQALMELFMKATGQDKKRVEVSGKVSVSHTGPAAVTSADAAKILDALMDDEGVVTALPAKGGQK